MRAVVQRVARASVRVDGAVRGEIGLGLLAFIGVGQEDGSEDAMLLSRKIAGLRCFQDEQSKFNLSVQDVGGSVLAISQFTLFGDCRKGKRPSFSEAAPPENAVALYEQVVEDLRAQGIEVPTGVFGAHMEVESMNDGPVTLLLDTRKVF